MDAQLKVWARRVKRRSTPPPLWLFTDEAAMPDLPATIAGLPQGLCGVVFRHATAPGRAALARHIAAICRARRIPLVIALVHPGDTQLAAALGAGLHLRANSRRPARHALNRAPLVTAAVHNRRQLTRARQAGADIAFISPVFATPSHPGRRPLGPAAWLHLACAARPVHAAALGGITGASIRRLGPTCRIAGGIGAFLH